MALGDDEGAVALAIAHLVHRLAGLVAVHDVLEGILLDVAQNPFLATAVAWGDVTPRVDKEEIAQCATGRTVLVGIATQAAMDRTVEVGTAIVLEAVLQVTALAGEQSLDKEFVLTQGLLALNLVVLLVEVPRVVDGTVTSSTSRATHRS